MSTLHKLVCRKCGKTFKEQTDYPNQFTLCRPCDFDYAEGDLVIAEACKRGSLAAALAHVAVWEHDRAMRYTLAHPGKEYETCFRAVFSRLLSRWHAVNDNLLE